MTGTALEIVTFLMGQDKSKQWDLEEHKEKKHRTLSQNKLYWEYTGQVAAALHVTNNFVHNTLLREVSIPFMFDGKPARVTLPDTDEAENITLESMAYHLKPTSQTWVGSDDVTYRTYVMLKGSSDMTTQEFSVLVDRLFERAHELGISTITPDELAHIRELELANEQRQKNKSNGHPAGSEEAS